jgi:hypothetical protein
VVVVVVVVVEMLGDLVMRKSSKRRKITKIHNGTKIAQKVDEGEMCCLPVRRFALALGYRIGA